MIIENFTFKGIIKFVNDVWAKSLAAIFMFFLGMWIGSINTESRIVSDCKFAGAFRADIQAFNCQRRI
jgi:hypothetical protein